MKDIDMSRVVKEIRIDENRKIILVNALGLPKIIPDELVSRNVFLVDTCGNIIWRIFRNKSIYPRSPFTDIYYDKNGRLMAYSFDGGEYLLDTSSGIAEPHRLLK